MELYKLLKVSFLFLFLVTFGCKYRSLTKPLSTETEYQKQQNTIDKLREWVNLSIEDRPKLINTDFAKKALSKEESEEAIIILVNDKKEQIIRNYGEQWDKRLLEYKKHKMPFFYQIFGKEPASGRSLFISLHGGGGVAAYMNDAQYNNQKHLYDATMKSLEGIYLAPRAPDNTWDLWHKDYIDEFLSIIIQLAVIKENVNPNKIYIIGYSAGGDGVYQLAPRMADRWAAASMMAGHPNDASPLGLRNTPFAIHVGALDSMYNRNKKAKEWGEILDKLEAEDPDSYIHDVQIHQGLAHWMFLGDAVALPWIAQFTRNPIPTKVVWKQDEVHHSSFYWLGVDEKHIQTGGEIIAEYNSSLNEINILDNYSDILYLMVNDNMLNLDNPITVKHKNTVIHKGLFKRTILDIIKNLSKKGDVDLTFPCIIKVQNNNTVIETKKDNITHL